jgi:hypothetical protein
MTMRAILLSVVWLALAACDGPRVETEPPPDQPASRSSGGTMGAVSKDAATTMARKGLQDLGRDPGRYDFTVGETDTEWHVRFAGKQPRPPGDEVTFYVNKQTGAIRHLLGE